MQKYWCYRCSHDIETCKTCKRTKIFNELQEKFKKLKFKVGDKIKFPNQRMTYKIRACNDRYIIATKPYNPQKTFLYTIIDLKCLVCGADNYRGELFNYEDEEIAEHALYLLNKKDNDGINLQISFRNFIALPNIEVITK